jgi:hypothetical protein
VKPLPGIRLLKVMHCSRPAALVRFFFAGDVLVVEKIR